VVRLASRPTARRKAGRGYGRWWFLLALGVAALVGGGVPLTAHIAHVRGQQDVGTIPRVARVQPAGLGAGVIPVAGSSSLAAHPPPVRVMLGRLRVDAPVRPVAVGADGLLGVPDDPRQLGWWSGSSRPGMPSGSVIIDGHVDSAALGLGALFHLGEARPGDDVVVANAAGLSTHYTVVARRSYPKTSLPVAEVFATAVSPRLVLVTCGGAFDRVTRHYADNIVVFAVPR
jgi:hypothetical protein